MVDKSHLDKKYFIDRYVYNCPYCNRNNVRYSLYYTMEFDWSRDKKCYIYIVGCRDCEHRSMHLSHAKIKEENSSCFLPATDIDSKIFYSAPTSFFVIDSRIPKIIRELITEAEGCVKMNFLTGASACIRKAIYEFLIKENAEGTDYEERIKFLKKKYSAIDGFLFDTLCHIKNMTSEKIHEQSWDKWDNKHITLFIETLKAILREIYVLSDEKRKRSSEIKKLLDAVKPQEKSQIKS